MATNYDFNFITDNYVILELPFAEHYEELSKRILQLCYIIVFIICLAFLKVKLIVYFLELPIQNVKFFQISPGEYFISTIKIAFYTGFLFSSPLAIIQLILFLLPGLTKKETQFLLPMLLISVGLFSLGLIFSYFVLIPATLTFFFNYSENVLEPLLSFDEYFEFVLVLFFTTGLIFQIPIIQILLGLLNFLSINQMIKGWRYVVLLSTIISAILTPSTDPLTQILLSTAIILLYFSGIGSLFLLKNYSKFFRL